MNKRKGNFLKILIVLLCLCTAILYAIVQSGANVPFLETYKNNFKHNLMGISNMLNLELPIEVQLYLDDTSAPTPKPTIIPAKEMEELEAALGYAQEEEIIPQEGTAVLTTKEPVKYKSSDALPIAVDSAENAKYAEYGDAILFVNETLYRAYSQSGKLLWDSSIQMQDPTLIVRGSYVLISETGAKKVSLYKGKKHLFTENCDGNIISADLSENGDIVLVTEKDYFKGQVVVFNKSGKIIYAWDSGSYNILDAAISKDRDVAVSLLNTDSGADSFISCFNVKGDTRYKTENFKNTIIFDLEYSGDRLNAISESHSIGINKKGKIIWDYSFDGKVLENYAIAKNGSKLLLFESGSTGEIVVVSAGGKSFAPIKTETMPDHISIKSDYIAYNSGRDIIITNFKGKKFLRTSCTSDIRNLIAVDKRHAFCVYSSSIQFKKLTKQAKRETVVAPTIPPAQEGE